jgi:thiol:disulfide interchange protein
MKHFHEQIEQEKNQKEKESKLNSNDDLIALLLAATKEVNKDKKAKSYVNTENKSTVNVVVEVKGLIIAALILAIGLGLAFNPAILTAIVL